MSKNKEVKPTAANKLLEDSIKTQNLLTEKQQKLEKLIFRIKNLQNSVVEGLDGTPLTQSEKTKLVAQCAIHLKKLT